jgi:hypothetical protein
MSVSHVQSKRFSFASVVLLLKVVSVQQGLDKPFTGGLGSYKLYVLVAHHVRAPFACNDASPKPTQLSHKHYNVLTTTD